MAGSGSDALLLVAGEATTPPPPEVAGLDPRQLAQALRAASFGVVARGREAELARALTTLEQAGVRGAVIPASSVREMPPAAVAGGVAAVSGGGVSLRVHGRPAGPSAGMPLLAVFGDLGRDARTPEAAEPRAGDTLRQRMLRAVCPVVEIVWDAGRLRVPVRGMAWRELPGRGTSAPDNGLRLLELLAASSGGMVLDLAFVGQELPIEPLRGALEPIEGADRGRTLLFERYTAAAAAAFRARLYPGVPAGALRIVGTDGASSGTVSPASLFARTPPSAASPVPWIRKGLERKARLRPWMLAPLAPLGIAIASKDPRIAAVLLAAASLSSVVWGLSRLSRRERLRAVPTSRIRSMSMGPVEVAGRILPTASFQAPYSRLPCAWYRFELQEKQAQARGEDRYVSLQTGSSASVPFRLDDGSGQVLVQPAGAEVEVEPLTTNLKEGQRALEWILPEGGMFFVAGAALRRSVEEKVEGPERDDVFVGAGEDGFLVISPRSYGEQSRRLAWWAVLGLAGGALGLLGALLLLRMQVS